MSELQAYRDVLGATLVELTLATAKNERLQEIVDAVRPLYHTQWPHRIYDIVAATDHDLAERFAEVMHDMHAAVLKLEESDDE